MIEFYFHIPSFNMYREVQWKAINSHFPVWKLSLLRHLYYSSNFNSKYDFRSSEFLCNIFFRFYLSTFPPRSQSLPTKLNVFFFKFHKKLNSKNLSSLEFAHVPLYATFPFHLSHEKKYLKDIRWRTRYPSYIYIYTPVESEKKAP